MGKYDHDPYGGLFDFNGDGKTDFAEKALGFQLFREQEAKRQKKYGHSTVPRSSSYRPRPTSQPRSHVPAPEPKPLTEEQRATIERGAKFKGHDSAEEWLESAQSERDEFLAAALVFLLFTVIAVIMIWASGESDGGLATMIFLGVLPPAILAFAFFYCAASETEKVRAAKKALEAEHRRRQG